MNAAALTLFLVGLLLLAFEVIVPGGILGAIGGLCLLAASVVVWVVYGAQWGLWTVLGSLVLAAVFFFLEIRLLKSGPFARHFVLSGRTPEAKAHVAEGIAPGTVGRTLTRLNPAGQVLVEGRRLEAHSCEGMIDEGVDVLVVSDDSFSVVVRRA